jgi:hypothetical protein
VLRRIPGPNKAELLRGWRKLHNEELFVKYNYNAQDKEDEVYRACGMNEE